MPSIILLHGALGASSSLLPLSKELNAFANVYTLDFSGHGSASWPEDFSIETFEQDVIQFMDTNNIEATHIFGYSMGGFIGLRLAAKIPERILSVTTLATKMDWKEETCIKESSMLDADVMELKLPKFIAALSTTHPQNGWRKLVEHTQQLLTNMHHYRFDIESLKKIKQLVCIMVGDKDEMVSINETIECYRSLPNAWLCVIPNTPHPLQASDPQLLASLIRRVIS